MIQSRKNKLPIYNETTRNMNTDSNLYVSILKFAVLLALIVVILGAYTRLSDAGLGCPDWPGCYAPWKKAKLGKK